MKKVVNVNLSGNAYQVEEAGFECLDDYLEGARLRLKGNPDLEEIMSDLEQSLAEKMHRFLSARKTVITAEEAEQIVAEMGPVNGAGEEDSMAGEHSARTEGNESRIEDERGEPGERKLFRLTGEHEEMLAGVCAGLSAYFGIDVSIVRIVFIALAFASAGLGILFYLVLALIIPSAKTPQQQAAAYGVPFDAREVMDRVRSKFDDIRNDREWKTKRRYWNRHARNAGFDGIGSILGLAVVLLAILVGLWLLQIIFSPIGIGMGMPMVIGPPGFHFIPWWAVLLMVIVAVYLIGWIFGKGKREGRSAFGSAFLKTVQVLLILFIIYVAMRILF